MNLKRMDFYCTVQKESLNIQRFTIESLVIPISDEYFGSTLVHIKIEYVFYVAKKISRLCVYYIMEQNSYLIILLYIQEDLSRFMQ